MPKFPGVLLLALAGCGNGVVDQRVQQCREVVGFWSANHHSMQHTVQKLNNRLQIDIVMTIESVLGEQQGSGRCLYSVSEPAGIAEQPYRITIGATVLTNQKDIEDALARDKDFDIPHHDH